MTLDPTRLDAAAARAVLDAGVSRDALVDAIHVAYLFNVYDRLADALGWDVPADGSGFYQSAARMLLKRGYRSAILSRQLHASPRLGHHEAR